MNTRGRVVHGPVVRLLCIACVTAGGALCLCFAAAMPWVVAGDAPPPDDWVEGVGEWWPLALLLAGAGLLQLAVAAWGVWSWGAAEGAG